MILITVHDKVAGTWSPPTVAHNKDAAIRDFWTACGNEQTIIGQHPYDFELYAIAEWIVPYDTTKRPTLSVFENFDFLECGVSRNEEK